MKNTIQKRLLEIRGNLSQQDFSKKTGVNQASLSKYERGDYLPSADAIKRISSACNVSSDWLLGLTDERSQASPSSHASTNTPITDPRRLFPPSYALVRMEDANSYNPQLQKLEDITHNDDPDSCPISIPNVRIPEGVFGLRISDDTMQPTFFTGDIVACKDEVPDNGNLCIAMHNSDGIMCKRWFLHDGFIRLKDAVSGSTSYEWSMYEFRKERPLIFRWRVFGLQRNLLTTAQ